MVLVFLELCHDLGLLSFVLGVLGGNPIKTPFFRCYTCFFIQGRPGKDSVALTKLCLYHKTEPYVVQHGCLLIGSPQRGICFTGLPSSKLRGWPCLARGGSLTISTLTESTAYPRRILYVEGGKSLYSVQALRTVSFEDRRR